MAHWLKEYLNSVRMEGKYTFRRIPLLTTQRHMRAAKREARKLRIKELKRKQQSIAALFGGSRGGGEKVQPIG